MDGVAVATIASPVNTAVGARITNAMNSAHSVLVLAASNGRGGRAHLPRSSVWSSGRSPARRGFAPPSEARSSAQTGSVDSRETDACGRSG